jgi:hypothetical protein
MYCTVPGTVVGLPTVYVVLIWKRKRKKKKKKKR